jgi:hypothetical protein
MYARIPVSGGLEWPLASKSRTRSRRILSAVLVTGQKGPAMDRDLIQLLRPLRARRRLESRTDLMTCSLCLRVLRGSEWVEAETIIREIRSYELEAPPRLDSGVCEHCAEAILSRRAQIAEAAAA